MFSYKMVGELTIFLAGILVRILGNLFAEFFIAYNYSEGIPNDSALIGSLVFGIFAVLIAVAIFVLSFLLKRMPDT